MYGGGGGGGEMGVSVYMRVNVHACESMTVLLTGRYDAASGL